MAFGWAGAAAGAAGAAQDLEQVLAEKLYRAQQIQLQQEQLAMQQQNSAADNQRADAQLGLQREQFDATQADRTYQRERQGTADRKQINLDEVRRMSVEGVRSGTAKPLDASLMALEEGVQIPETALDPEAPQRRMIDLENLRHTNDMREIGARGQNTSAATPQQDWVIRDGKPIPIPRGTAQPGDQPYDAVAARSAQPTNTAEAVDTAREVSRIAGALRQHSGLPGVFGVVSSRMPTIRQGTADAETLLNSLKGLLTIENMGKMKGVLSDSDMRILQQASTTLDARMSESAARAELDRLVSVMGKVAGGVPQGGADPNDALLDELLRGGQ